MTMAPETRQIIELMEAFWPNPREVGAAEARRRIAEYAKEGLANGEPVADVHDRAVPGPAGDIPVRVYRPSIESGLPVIAFFHGGGFTIGGLDTHDGVCRQIANRAGALVLSVDYRLAPEHPFPAAVDDCYAATEWLAANAGSALDADGSRLAIAGDSAGGNLAAVVAQVARDRGGPAIVHQLLVYPVTDFSEERHRYPSHVENATGYFLTHDETEWFRSQYLASEDDAADPLASPARADDLSGLPPATVITAEFDPLRDEGEMYGQRLRDAGVPVELRRFDGMFHGFFSMGAAVADGRAAVDLACAALRAALHRG